MGERRSGRSCAEEPGQGAAPDMERTSLAHIPFFGSVSL